MMSRICFGLGILCLILSAGCQPAEVAPPNQDTTADSKIESADLLVEQAQLDRSLLFIDVRGYPDHKITRLDLETESETTLFQVPENGYVHQIDIDSTSGRVALSYSEPPPSVAVDQAPLDRSGIYVAELGEDGMLEVPRRLFGSDTAQTYLFDPVWAGPDSEHLFYVQYQYSETGETPIVDLYRYDLEADTATLIAPNGIWPRVSPDRERLVYIEVDPVTLDRRVIITDVDLESETVLIDYGDFFDLDTPHFSADGAWIYFSAVPHSATVDRAWWEILLGIQVASAHTDHNIPSDWWRVSVDGSAEPERVGDVQRIITHGRFDSSGENLYFAAFSGVFRMSDLDEDPVLEQISVAVPSRYVIVLD